jgi:adenylylsulfate kinase-like enzyme
VPRSPEVHIDTTTTSAEEAAEQVVEALRRMGIVS